MKIVLSVSFEVNNSDRNIILSLRYCCIIFIFRKATAAIIKINPFLLTQDIT